jgi:hypothetical protein
MSSPKIAIFKFLYLLNFKFLLQLSLFRLTYTNPVLLGRIKTDLLEFLKHKETHWEQVVLVVSYFGITFNAPSALNITKKLYLKNY